MSLSAAAAIASLRLLDPARVGTTTVLLQEVNQCHANCTGMTTRLLTLLAGDLNTFARSNHFVGPFVPPLSCSVWIRRNFPKLSSLFWCLCCTTWKLNTKIRA